MVLYIVSMSMQLYPRRGVSSSWPGFVDDLSCLLYTVAVGVSCGMNVD